MARQAPAHRFSHFLNVTQGIQPGNPGAPVTHRVLADAITIDPFYGGRIVSANSDGQWVTGALGTQVPHFLIRDSDDTDVGRYTDRAQGIKQVGQSRHAALPCLGNYHVQTSEFDDDQNYAYNAPLRGIHADSTAATGGLVTSAGVTLFTNNIIGFVKEPPAANAQKVRVLEIYAYWIPGTAGN